MKLGTRFSCQSAQSICVLLLCCLH